MSCSCLRVVYALGLTAWALAYACPGVAGSHLFSPFTSPAFNRKIHGDTHSLALSANGRGLGSAAAFFGVDSLSDANQQYLTSGVQWKISTAGASSLQLSAVQTEANSGGFGGQTLLRVESRFDLGEHWYMPGIHSEIDRVSNSKTALGGFAARLGLTGDLGMASYTLDYFQADPQFNALGSTVVAGDHGLELSSQYTLDDTWQISSHLGLHQPAVAAAPRLVQRWVMQRKPRLTDIGSSWRLSAQFGSATAAQPEQMPIAIALAAETARWRSWRIDSALGWYTPGVIAPYNLPVAGAMWRISAHRGLDIAGFETEWSPSFSLGGSRYRDCGLASRSGLALGFPKLSDNINFSIDYLSSGWGPRATRDDVQMMLNYTRNIASLLP
jgi:hypothetical protein